MPPDEINTLFVRAVAIARDVTGPREYEQIWQALEPAAADPSAVRIAEVAAESGDPVVRATACDLLGLLASRHEAVRAGAATTLLAVADGEPDTDVRASIARALGCTGDPRAVRVLVGYARDPDADVRFQVASALPLTLCEPGHPDDPDGVVALIELSGDRDSDVRNWATFGLGWQSTADDSTVRQALWDRVTDSDVDTQDEAVRGLARRHDRRVRPLLARMLGEGIAHLHTFDAAAFLADPALLPALRRYDPADRGVTGALRECDPELHERRDADALTLVDAIRRRLPDVTATVYGQRFEIGLELLVTTATGREVWWDVTALLARAGDDPAAALRLVVDDLAHPAPCTAATLDDPAPDGDGPVCDCALPVALPEDGDDRAAWGGPTGG